jgi:Protein of unknown function (DUF1615)
MRSILAGALLLLLAAGCVRSVRPDGPTTPRLTVEQATALVPSHVPDREGWALDVLTALDGHHFHPDLETVCQVLAVVEQESGYKANPPVAKLAKIARDRLDGYASKLGPLGPPMMDKLLEGRTRGWKSSFKERLERVRTERDLDLIFRDLLGYYEEEFPGVYTAVDLVSELSGRGGLEALNPITTAGSMQVSVRFSVELSEREGLDEARVRDRLYTRAGGVHYGSARLLGYEADYDRAVYRFADYNAGFFASRNAAFQEQLAALTKRKLSLDGDLLIYEKDQQPADRDSNTLRALLSFREQFAPSLSERQLRRDVRLEKTRGFEDTDTWRALKRSFEKVTGKPATYARLPEVAIRSPKLSRERSTAWFARSVDARYQRCLDRGR